MNYAIMTFAEVLNYGTLHASTDLERALVRVLDEAEDESRSEIYNLKDDLVSLEESLRDAQDVAALNAEERDKLQEILEDPDKLAVRLAELLCSS